MGEKSRRAENRSRVAATSAPAKITAKQSEAASGIATGESSGLGIVVDEHGRASLGIRSRLRMSRETFARLVPISTRLLASIEAGNQPQGGVHRKLLEIQRVVDALSEVIASDAIGPWLNQPNDAFDGLKPIEVIERGQVDRIWRMIFLLRSGVSF